MMPLDMRLYSSFSYHGPPGFSRGGITPMVSVAGLQHVSSSMWRPPGLTSPHLPFTTKTLNAEQTTEICHLMAECQALGTKLAKQFHFQDLRQCTVLWPRPQPMRQSMWGAWPGTLPKASCQMARLRIKA